MQVPPQVQLVLNSPESQIECKVYTNLISIGKILSSPSIDDSSKKVLADLFQETDELIKFLPGDNFTTKFFIHTLERLKNGRS